MKETVAEFLEFRYEKLKRLKFSERGEVWLASARRSGELVIIKRVAATGLPYDVIKNSAFTLPAKVLYCAADATETVIVEEFIQGENLLERLAKKKFLDESEARAILLQMCDGLAELHAQKIIHRDIKPSNMILQSDKIARRKFGTAANSAAINVGAATDFVIPFDTFELPNNKLLFVCLQIYLNGDESKTDEHYWCV